MKSFLKSRGMKMGADLVSKYAGYDSLPGIGDILGGREFLKGPAQKNKYEDGGFVEEFEECNEAMSDREKIQAAIEYINEVLASGE